MMRLFFVFALWAFPLQAQEAVALYGPVSGDASRRLVIEGSTDVAPFTPFLEAFSRQNPQIAIRYEQWSTNDIYTRAVAACRNGSRSADLLISSSIDQQIKLANDGCAQSYRSAATDSLPEWAVWRNEVFGLTREPAVIVYNRDLVSGADVPHSRFDLFRLLRKPGNRFAGRIATYDIEQSGLGYLFAFADAQQATTFGRLIETFGRNGAVATCCSAEIIDRVASGEFLIAYNLLGSYAMLRAADDPRIGVTAPTDYTLLLARAAVIPGNSRNVDGARRFIDFALAPEGRDRLAEGHLIVEFSEEDGSNSIQLPDSSLRPIKFSPVLLVGLDAQKKALFLDLWRSSVSQLGAP
ncbi:ABC transporter substrate-binding protein [Nisaea sp.]|uniref:ABC transporter substrate-binding protein n=1 Tax=Nisaea sp. TaxID=2024842 RepID=UPI003B52C848